LQAIDKSPVNANQERRAAALRRAFQRELGCKPTTIEGTLMDRAAVLTAKAEAAALNPATTANDVVRLDHAAARARAAMFQSFAMREAKRPSLQELEALASDT
jgi:hypothetical protein